MRLRYQNGDSDLDDSSAIPIRYNQICYAFGLVVSNVSLTLTAKFTLAQKKNTELVWADLKDAIVKTVLLQQPK